MRSNNSLQEQVLASLSDAALNLILLPTEKCNFRCTYCYEDFVVGRMQSDTLLGIRRLLERRAPQLSFLDIEWFGGEPMLASDIVEEISAHCCELAEQYPSLSYSAGSVLAVRDARSVSLGVRNERDGRRPSRR
jgi:uncharacterized protein